MTLTCRGQRGIYSTYYLETPFIRHGCLAALNSFVLSVPTGREREREGLSRRPGSCCYLLAQSSSVGCWREGETKV